MKPRDSGSGLVKAAVTLCLLAGVFVMHGLTGNHDVAMASGDPMPAAVGQHHVHEVAELAPGEHRHSMGDICLAMLTVLGVAIIVALALRSLRVSHPVQLLARVSTGVAPERSPPCPRPSLSKLCVLRI